LAISKNQLLRYDLLDVDLRSASDIGYAEPTQQMGCVSIRGVANQRFNPGQMLIEMVCLISIVEVDPATGKPTRKYGGVSSQNTYSNIRGKHQSLTNGNILITESQAGRVFEVNDKGEIVWEFRAPFINRYDADHVSIVRQASRYPENYCTVQDWTCPMD
jgi:hypothetical protein